MSIPLKRGWTYSAKIYRRSYTTDDKGAPVQSASLGTPVLKIDSGCLLLQGSEPMDDVAGGESAGLPFTMMYDHADIRLDDTITSTNYPGIVLHVDSVHKVPGAVMIGPYMVVEMTGFREPA